MTSAHDQANERKLANFTLSIFTCLDPLLLHMKAIYRAFLFQNFM